VVGHYRRRRRIEFLDFVNRVAGPESHHRQMVGIAGGPKRATRPSNMPRPEQRDRRCDDET
jgi:hypothetical protein